MSIRPTLFEMFGGIRPMAKALGERPSTVGSWKSTGRIPSDKQPSVLGRAEALGLDVTTEDVVFPLGRPVVAFDHISGMKEGDA